MGNHKFAIRISVKGVALVLIIAAYFTLLNLFAGSDEWKQIDHIYTFLFLATLTIAAAINSWIMVPKFLKRKRYPLFLLAFTVNILSCTYFNHLLFDKLIDHILPGYYFISYYGFIDLLKFFLVFVVLTMLLQLSLEWFQLQEAGHQLVRVEKEKIDAELKALMNQVNPHFLFNSLTVLYSLALKKSAETPDAIVKLSDILRYVIYDSASGKVPLKSEVNLIRNYIDLQGYRVHSSASIKFVSSVQDEELLVEPMLFLPLVENSFKHGVKNDVAQTYIDIVLQSKDGVINFNISNNRSDEYSTEKNYGGIGLKNIEERLKLVYKGNYTFAVNETERSFIVNLMLNTEK